MTTTIIADDHEIVRRGIRGILESECACTVVAEASDGLAAAQLVEKHRPDVLILDLNMPRLHGIEVLRQSRTSSPQTRVIVLSMHNDEPYVIESLRAFDLVWIVNRGRNGLELISALVTSNVVGEASRIGFGSALATIMLVISLVFIVIYLWTIFSEEEA